jgi:hypothetical protein
MILSMAMATDLRTRGILPAVQHVTAQVQDGQQQVPDLYFV